MRVAAGELRAHGDAAAGLHIAGEIADLEAARGPSLELANALYEAERWDQARIVFEQLGRSNTLVLGRLGVLAARRGDRAEAMRVSDTLAALPNDRGSTSIWQARIAAQLGDAQAAVNLLRRAFAEGATYGIWLHTDPDFLRLHSHPSFRSMLRGAD